MTDRNESMYIMDHTDCINIPLPKNDIYFSSLNSYDYGWIDLNGRYDD